MEAVPHGIGVQNRYALFYDEGLDPLEILKLTEEQKTKKKTEKTVKVKNAKPTAPKKPAEIVPAKVVKAPETDVSKPKGKPILQSKVSNPIDARENDKNTRNRDDGYFGGEARENSEFRRGGRGGFRGRGGPGRGRGFFNAADNKSRRVFDRKSGNDKTGVRPVEKREGAGANNWGDIRSDCSNTRREETTWDEEFEGEANPRQEFNSSGDENITEFGKTEDPKNDSVEGTETKENDQTLDEQAQEAMKEMTLDEYKKEQESKRAVPKYNLRKPGEGEDDKQWKKGYVLKKKPKEDDDDQDEDDDIEDEEYGRKAQQKVLLDIQFNFADSRRGNRGRGRGGRGGPRTGPRDATREDRPRGARIGGTPKGKGQQAAPRVDDFNDFPSLINA